MFILGFGGATAVIHVPKSGFLNFINYYPPFLGHAIKLHVVPFFKLGVGARIRRHVEIQYENEKIERGLKMI